MKTYNQFITESNDLFTTENVRDIVQEFIDENIYIDIFTTQEIGLRRNSKIYKRDKKVESILVINLWICDGDNDLESRILFDGKHDRNQRKVKFTNLVHTIVNRLRSFGFILDMNEIFRNIGFSDSKIGRHPAGFYTKIKLRGIK